MDKKIDWSKAPDWAGAVISSQGGQQFFVTGLGVVSQRQGVSESEPDGEADTIEPHAWTLVEERPPATPAIQAIKTLEQRIIERAEQRLQGSVEDAMMKLRIVAGVEVSGMASGINGMTVREAIDSIGAAIVRLKAPIASGAALERALEDLADHLEPSRLIMPTTQRSN